MHKAQCISCMYIYSVVTYTGSWENKALELVNGRSVGGDVFHHYWITKKVLLHVELSFK